jgi:hypothetical protein
MSATPPNPSSRPRIVDTAFWCWVSGAVLTAALGMLTLSQGGHPFVYAAGGLMIAAGLGLGYLAGRARRGEGRFAGAAVGLAMASVAFLALLLLFGAGAVIICIVAVTMALLIAGSVLVQRGVAQEWFEEAGGAQ